MGREPHHVARKANAEPALERLSEERKRALKVADFGVSVADLEAFPLLKVRLFRVS